ncbi:GtrA family protein [Pseudomonas mosselii]|uniref:GtrA family protein n=1 Tax=Pseudomonas mosselii TaxID=78327 RepID=UPI0024499569|nr:GtrA family protein [Pseudomonas mosselii]MDH0626913.1 GtrA family protein [Pseudomonas mosselii]MDH0678513.1 GtrA family protein [Pseudomonas mosselii]MDH0923776.1 GtrA family protein [Pseudomonas mosselii]MDH1134225.1 GtrA family protein [Pseudomonas mosselii]MDH1138137.1 GtrA family protein [Pseudomonas mosselii]
MLPLRSPSATTLAQFIRYNIVGVTSNGLVYLGYLLLVYADVGKKLSMTLMYLIGVVLGFIANLQWTFMQGKQRGVLLRYVQMHIIGYLLNFLLLLIFSDLLGYPHQAVQAVAILVVALYGFLACKYFVFRGDSK